MIIQAAQDYKVGAKWLADRYHGEINPDIVSYYLKKSKPGGRRSDKAWYVERADKRRKQRLNNVQTRRAVSQGTKKRTIYGCPTITNMKTAIMFLKGFEQGRYILKRLEGLDYCNSNSQKIQAS